MADCKPPQVNTCTVDDCTPMFEGGPHWFDPHMPCWICNRDDKRDELMWNDECTTYFHRSCLIERHSEAASN